MKRNSFLGIAVLLLASLFLVLPILSGCSAASSPVTPATPATPASSSATDTLKIGLVVNLGWPLGLDFSRAADLMKDKINSNGGLTIGDKKYKLDLLIYDSKANNETAQAAAERLISQDNVKFMMGDDTVVSWCNTAEQSKVVTLACTPSELIYNPKFQYVFQGMTGADTNAPELWGRFAKDHPNLKTCLGVFPDDQTGHIYGGLAQKLANTFGPKMTESDTVWYPREQTDFSAVGTKVKNINPDCLVALAGGPIQDNLVYKSAYQAGWKGQQFTYGTISTEVLVQVLPVDAMEGMILGAFAVELDNPPPAAKEFRDAYIAKNGKWDGPELVQASAWWMLTDALQAAKSIDANKVASVLGNGLKYSSPCCSAVMVSRPDLGISRTVDTVGGLYLKQIINGQKKIIAEIPMEEAIQYNAKFYGWK
jgi:branched-chain amino acid transport system substrate-binding protein